MSSAFWGLSAGKDICSYKDIVPRKRRQMSGGSLRQGKDVK